MTQVDFYLLQLPTAQDRLLFACRLAQGIGLLIAIEVLINTGVNMGVLPTKGLPLPFISQGGSSLLASSIAMGLLFAVARETTPQPGRKR